MNFNKKSMKYAVAIFTVFAISGLLYTSSITQYGFAQNNSSSNNSSSNSGSGSQGNSSSGESTSGQQNGIGTAAEMHNLTGAGTQQILSNNSKISNTGGLSKLGNESTTPQPSQGKPAPQSQPFPTQNQAAGQSGNQSLSGQNVGQSQNQTSSSGGAGQQSSGGAGQSQNQTSSSGGAGQSKNQSSNPLDMLAKLFRDGK